MARKTSIETPRLGKAGILNQVAASTGLTRKQVTSVLDTLAEVIESQGGGMAEGTAGGNTDTGVGRLAEEHVMFMARPSARVVKARPLDKLKLERAVPSKPKLGVLDVGARVRDPQSGRLDADRLSKLLGLAKSDIATRICGVTRQSLGQNPTSAGIQEKLRPLEEIAQALIWCGGDEVKFRVWLNRPNRDFPMVDGRTPSPMDLILLGHAEVVAKKVGNLRTGHPA